jgi:hypothetical protein
MGLEMLAVKEGVYIPIIKEFYEDGSDGVCITLSGPNPGLPPAAA